HETAAYIKNIPYNFQLVYRTCNPVDWTPLFPEFILVNDVSSINLGKSQRLSSFYTSPKEPSFRNPDYDLSFSTTRTKPGLYTYFGKNLIIWKVC
ncbi:16617_t:CDS:2, partial [Funneliformis caledonium]